MTKFETAPKYARPEYDLVLEQVAAGLMVTQAGRTYLARKWALTPEVRGVVGLALEYGLTCLWQQGHPGGDTSHHISFSFERTPASWVFVIGAEAGPPEVRRVTFNKKLREYFKSAGLDWTWEWETAGGKNILVAPSDLESVLRTLPLDEIKCGCLPRKEAVRTDAARKQYYRNECELEEDLARMLSDARPSLTIHRQRPFAANTNFERACRPDILSIESDRVLIIETKLYDAGDAELAQILRYLSNHQLAAAFHPRPCYGVLVAERFTERVISAVSNRADISLVSYGQSVDGALTLAVIAGPDLLTQPAKGPPSW